MKRASSKLVDVKQGAALTSLLALVHRSVLVVLANDTDYNIWSLSPDLRLIRQSTSRGLAVPAVVELTDYLLVERVAADQIELVRLPSLP